MAEQTMVERVAKAIHEEDGFDIGYRTAGPWDDEEFGCKKRRLSQARAAIEAMREPTDAMAVAPLSLDHGGGPSGRCGCMACHDRRRPQGLRPCPGRGTEDGDYGHPTLGGGAMTPFPLG